MNQKRENIEAILPLLPNQQAYHWARNQSSPDPGCIQATCRLHGTLDLKIFQSAWDEVCRRHETLRSSVHQPKEGEPKVVIWKQLRILVQAEESSSASGYLPIETSPTNGQASAIIDLPLDAPPVSRLSIRALSPREHSLRWTFHHAFLDGWSTSVVLRDLLAIYHSIFATDSSSLAPAPRFRDYVAWYRRESLQEMNTFWSEQMSGFKGLPKLPSASSNSGLVPHHTVQKQLSPTQRENLTTALSDSQLTGNTLATAAWALTLAELYSVEDVAVGMTVSGRAAPLPDMPDMVGLLTNVIPLRTQLRSTVPVLDWLRELRGQQFDVQRFEHCSLAEIESTCRLDRGTVLFESLLVVQNIPQVISSDSLELTDYDSGATSQYPISIYFFPARGWAIKVVSDPRHVSTDQAEWIADRLMQGLLALITACSNGATTTIADLRDQITGPSIQLVKPAHEENTTVGGPTNDDEAQLVSLWEQILGIVPVGIEDDFFEIGGRSLTAVTLLTRVEEIWGHRFTPSILLENRTVAQFAVLLRSNGQPPHPTLVRFNRVSTGIPLVCVNAGGETSMYFRHLAKYFPNRPVIGLHLRSLEGSRPHRTFEGMATEYLEALAEYFPQQSVHLIGYCQGTCVALAMARHLEATDYPPASFTSIDSPVSPAFEDSFAQCFPSGHASPTEFTGWIIRRLRHIFLRPLRWAYQDAQLVLSGKLSDRRIFWGLRTWRKCMRARRYFRPQPIKTNIHLIESSEYATLTTKKYHHDWVHFTRGEYTHEIVNADHQTILLEPQVQEIVTPLRKRLDQAAPNAQISPPPKASLD